MTRRQAVKLGAGLVTFLHGQPVGTQNVSQYAQQMRAPSQTLLVALDAVDVIAFQYRGRRVTISPNELLDALGGK